MLLDISKAANAHLDLGHVLDALAQSLSPLIRFNAIAVDLIDQDFLRLHSVSLKDFPRLPGESLSGLISRYQKVPEEVVAPTIQKGLPLHESRLCAISRDHGPYVCSDLEQQKLYVEEELFYEFGVRSYICLPLWKRDHLLGALYFNLDEKREFSRYEIQLVEDAGEVITMAVKNALAYEMIQSLKERVQQENILLRDEIVQRSMYEEIIGSSPALLKVLRDIDRVAPTDSTVLISGETGTGKELLARAIHRRSPRASRALVKVNCAALPAELIASELFGHERGAFTGALNQRIGRFETADGGTIFLDEIGELAPDMQVALLRVLQEKEYERVGGNITRRTDVRVIAATNRNLEREVAGGQFRGDLYYRLNVFPMEAPALRNRRDDIPALVEYFASRFAKSMHKNIERIEKSAIASMQNYSWPGNIRELQNVVERAVILSDGPILQLDPASFPKTISGAELQDPREEILRALEATQGRISGAHGAAARLGVPASTLESRIRNLGINKYQYKKTS
ncbi:sigma 54-interacting transcriptional regulator [Bryobacter aggregatus]|uniref:sigma 54-interacting transcriptional regulator n=1 Tax=Bryobacter aggregatus TaxID=360054 RepID=UPI00138DE54D|nr:sigma 54-interacting transcriptional regulator [Bryobacter aggregatus]